MNLFFQKTDAKQLGYLRIIIGSWFFIDWTGMMLIGYVDEAYISSQLNFPFIGFEWVKPLPEWGMYLVFSLGAIAALGITFGWKYRLSVAVFFLLQLYVFMLDIVYTLNKFYLFLLLALVLFVVPAHKAVSLLVKKKPQLKITTVARWNVLIFQFMLLLIYTYSGISKLTPDWLVLHEPLNTFLDSKWPFSALGEMSFERVITVMTYGGLVFDLTMWFWLINRKTRWFANIWQTCFHLLNFTFLGVGSLSIYMCLLTWLLFPPKQLKERLKLDAFEGLKELSAKYRMRIQIALISFVIIMLLLPHRHYLIDNNVNWTEKGHRFSWRLMTRTKRGSSSVFVITDNQTNHKWTINPKQYLTGRQYRKMSAETDLVIYFAHWLEGEWESKGFDDVSVSAFVYTRLNGRSPQLLIDPELDLTKIERTVWSDKVSTVLEDN